MQERGLVERRPHPSDRRRIQLYLTTQAHPLLHVMRQLGEQTRGEAMHDLSERDSLLLQQFLIRMRENLLVACSQPVDDEESSNV